MDCKIAMGLMVLNMMGLVFNDAVYASEATKDKDKMEQEYQLVSSNLNVIARSKDINDFVKIGADIDGLLISQKQGSKEWLIWRRTKTEFWLKAINVLEQNMDLSFDPTDVPQINVAPPSSSGLDSGIDPSEIKDANVREQYEQAIEANDKKAERYRFQKKLRELDKAWASKVKTHIKGHYTSDPKDIEESRIFIEAWESHHVRRKNLENLVPKRAP